MEKSYKFTITTMDGEEKEIEVLHLTLRHGLRLHSLNTDASIEEVLLDMLAPGVLDIISPESLFDLVETIMEKDKAFFDRLTKAAIKPNKKGKSKSKK